MFICKGCHKEFKQKPRSKYFDIDGLCSYCRKLLKETQDRQRKTKVCPGCGKQILKNSKYCSSCSQQGKQNHRFTTGHTSKARVCRKCKKHISPGSTKGFCSACRSKQMGGNNNPNFRGGDFTNLVYSLQSYKDWRQQVYKRDNYRCRCCGYSKRGELEAHHILPKSRYPEFVFDVNNGITLCKQCHRSVYGKEHKFVTLFQELVNTFSRIKTP